MYDNKILRDLIIFLVLTVNSLKAWDINGYIKIVFKADSLLGIHF